MSYRRIFKGPVLALAVSSLLSGCGWIDEWRDAREIKPPQPQMKVTQTGDATWMTPSGQKPVERLVPAEDPGTQDAIKRLDELEKEMAAVRNDISMMLPALTRLAESQADIQAMIANAAQPAAGEEAFLPPGEMAPAVEKPLPVIPLAEPVVPLAETPPAPAAEAGIKQIRFGTHPDKTRVVLDATGDATFSYDLDNEENILMLDIAGMEWNGAKDTLVPDSPLLASWSAEPDGKGGTRVAILLKQAAKVVMAQALPAAPGKDARIVIDLAGI